MTDTNTVMAVDKSGNDITEASLRNWINDAGNNKNKLSNFIFERLYGRYIRPFEFNDPSYIKSYKNGFTIMANCCLLIETFASFRVDIFKDTKGKSEKCFGWFFLTEDKFHQFSKRGLAVADYLSNVRINNRGVPRDFYVNVRCGILHNGETRNGWKVVRKGNLYDSQTKKINAVEFMNELKNILCNYQRELNANEIQSDIWNVCIERVKFLISST